MRTDDVGRDAFDPELDLLRRYNQMIQTQIDTLHGIDNKAAYIARLVGLLAGLVISISSIVIGTGLFQPSRQTASVVVMVDLGAVALFIALVYAVITYLSSEFEYGPIADLGPLMAEYTIQEHIYRDMLLRGYSEAIAINQRVINRNARRFEVCLTGFLIGIHFLFSAGALLITPSVLLIEAIVVLISILIAIRVIAYILGEEYLVVERQRNNNG